MTDRDRRTAIKLQTDELKSYTDFKPAVEVIDLAKAYDFFGEEPTNKVSADDFIDELPTEDFVLADLLS